VKCTVRKDKRNLIQEMTSYEFVSSLEQINTSKSKNLGYLTYSDEPPKKSEGGKPALEDIAVASLEKMESLCF
jgi:hypothetical protein